MSSRKPFPTKSNSKTSFLFLAITISAFLIILFAILYFLYFLWYSLVKRSRTNPFDTTTQFNKLQRFCYKELKNATHNFNESNCIGKGGSGSVYTGMLKDGRLVAVKLLDSNSFQCEQEFSNELKILGGLMNPCSFVVSLLGFCVEKEKRVLVYEYLPNKSLQESLFFDCNDLGLNWSKRFSIVLDVAKALAFLHLECDPPVIHGDVKPSNVLLDIEFRAKLSDFGLSRLKFEGEFGVDLFSQDFGKSQELWKSQELSGNLNAGRENESTPIGTPVESHGNDEVDFALALQASSSSKNSCKIYNNLMVSPSISSLNFNFKFAGENGNEIKNLKGKESTVYGNGGEDWNKSVPCDEDFSMDHSKELDLSNSIVNDDLGAKQWGKDWWWRQDGSGELCSKDYVKEWIGSQISTDNWDVEKGPIEEKIDLDNSLPLEKFEEANESPIQESGFEHHGCAIEKEDSKRWRIRAKKHRTMHEWWKEENLEEVGKRRNANRLMLWSKKRFKVPHFGLGKRFHFRRKRIQFVHVNENMKAPNTEFSFRKGWRRKKSRSSDMWSGDVFSRELSSTTSMRGTLCYVAPEYGGCGYLMEKADIYSFGVLILVIISGRRPLHILSSPMKFEKANLISWARQLAHNGNVLELVDEKLGDDFDKEEAGLCINLALACLQKMPELRPDIGDVVKILKGEMELPQLPIEFSPSPPSKCFGRSRRKQYSIS